MSSSHCLGMCGGIGAALGASGTPRAWWFGIAYNVGRIGCYTLLGALAGGAVALLDTGSRAWLPQLGLWLRTLAGLLVIAMGLYISGWWFGLARLEALGDVVWRRVQPLTRTLLPPRNPGAALALGAAWGLLPCGLIYSSLGWAATAGSALRSAELMALFGVGTLPAMLAATLGGQRVRSCLQRPLLRRVAGLLLIALGIATIALPWQHSASAADHTHHHH
jgi:sulfite exporter TauE/SafE